MCKMMQITTLTETNVLPPLHGLRACVCVSLLHIVLGIRTYLQRWMQSAPVHFHVSI